MLMKMSYVRIQYCNYLSYMCFRKDVGIVYFNFTNSHLHHDVRANSCVMAVKALIFTNITSCINSRILRFLLASSVDIQSVGK